MPFIKISLQNVNTNYELYIILVIYMKYGNGNGLNIHILECVPWKGYKNIFSQITQFFYIVNT